MRRKYHNTLLFLTELVKTTYIQRTQRFSTNVFTKCVTGSRPAKLMCLLYVPNAVSSIKADYLPKKHCFNCICSRDGRFSVRQELNFRQISDLKRFLLNSSLSLHIFHRGFLQAVLISKVSYAYSRINSIKSPASGAGNVSEPRLMSQVVYAQITCSALKAAKVPVLSAYIAGAIM